MIMINWIILNIY